MMTRGWLAHARADVMFTSTPALASRWSLSHRHALLTDVGSHPASASSSLTSSLTAGAVAIFHEWSSAEKRE